MAMTPLSSATPYATPADMLLYRDARIVGQLCSDANTQLDSAAILISTRLLEMLAAASGEIESAAMVGQRYLPVDLQAIRDSVVGSTATMGARMLKKLCCDLAFYMLVGARDPGSKATDVNGAELAMGKLKALRLGEVVFSLEEAAEAGASLEVVETPQGSTADVNSILNRGARFFGTHTGHANGSR